MTDFPTLSKQPDAETYKVMTENVAKSSGDTDGGYEFTRPKFTRRGRRTISFQYKDITNADRATLQDFWDSVKGGSVAFNFTDPTSGTIYNVRFTADMTLTFNRAGFGNVHHWDTDVISMKEV